MRKFDLAYVAHATPTRLRLRVPTRRRDAAFFDRLARQIESGWASVRAEGHPLTGSLVLTSRHRFDWSCLDLAAYGLAVVSATADQAPVRVFSVLCPAAPPASATHVQLRAAPAGADADLGTLGVQLACSLLTGRPLAALLQWAAERVLQSLLSHLLRSPGLRV